MRALKVPPVVPYKALENFSKALYGTTGGTYSARIFRSVVPEGIRFINFIIFELFVVDGGNGIAAHVLASTCVSTTKDCRLNFNIRIDFFLSSQHENSELPMAITSSQSY